MAAAVAPGAVMPVPALKELRIAFVAGTLGQGGAEQQLFYVLRTLAAAGAEVRVLCLTRQEFWEERIRALGVSVCFVGARASRLARLARVVRELRRRRPHIVQSQHFYTNLYAAVAARLLRLPEIGAVRNDARSEVRANGRLLGRWSLRVPRVLAANSRLGVANAAALGVPPARVRFLPNVVDTDHFTPAVARDTGAPGHGARDNGTRNNGTRDNGTRDNSAHGTAPIRLLAVGRLTEQKRFDRFLDILARLRADTGVDVRATIAGTGPLASALETRAGALGLRPPVLEFAGAVADMRPLYQHADVLVLCSQWEGTPNVVMEAMASGLAVVSTPVGGVPDLIRDGETGILIEGNDETTLMREFCRVLQHLIAAPDRRRTLGLAARAAIVEQHSLVALPRLLTELYSSVLRSPARP